MLFSHGAQRRFDALDQPLPQGRHSPRKNDDDAGDGQIGLDRRRQRRGGHPGQPRILGLRGSIDRARPLRIVDDFRGDLGKADVDASKIEERPARGLSVIQSMSLGPSAVMITLSG